MLRPAGSNHSCIRAGPQIRSCSASIALQLHAPCHAAEYDMSAAHSSPLAPPKFADAATDAARGSSLGERLTTKLVITLRLPLRSMVSVLRRGVGRSAFPPPDAADSKLLWLAVRSAPNVPVDVARCMP